MKSILCYGDSNTYGLMPDLKNRYPRNIRWTGRLQELLGPDYYVIEEGLGGRTTVWDDPVEGHKNGRTYLLPCLDSHKPIDLIVIMLGTNDLKTRFHVSSFDIATSMESLIHLIEQSDAGPGFQPPKILLMTPVPIRRVGNVDLERMLEGGYEKAPQLEAYYRDIAARHGIYYLNPEEFAETSSTDGIHFTEAGHAKLAEALAQYIPQIL